MHKLVIYIVSYTSIFSLTPWRNSIKLLLKEGYRVVVIQFRDNNNRLYKSPEDDGYEICELKYPVILRFLMGALDRAFKCFSYIGIKQVSNVGQGMSNIFKAILFIIQAQKRLKRFNPAIIVSGDPSSLISAFIAQRKIKSALVYWSLELHIYRDLKDFGLKILKRLEIKCNKSAALTIDFGKMRCELLEKENKLSKGSVISIPNSAIGSSIIRRNFYFNKKYDIPYNRKIILHAGGVYAKGYGIRDLIHHVQDWPSDCDLVIHACTRSKIWNKLKIPNILENRIFFDDDILPFDQIGMIYSSCDIGLMLHQPEGGSFDTNLIYTDLSSGKMFNYVKYGVPLIVRNLPGMEELVESNGVGVCINEPSEISNAIIKIINRLSEYKSNCKEFQEKMRFERHHKQVIEKINAITFHD